MTIETPETHQEKLAHLDKEMGVYGVPDHLRAGLLRYLGQGGIPGSFLAGALANDLCFAVLRADPSSLAGLPNLMRFLNTEAPPGSWGSHSTVRAWIASGGLAGSGKVG